MTTTNDSRAGVGATSLASLIEPLSLAELCAGWGRSVHHLTAHRGDCPFQASDVWGVLDDGLAHDEFQVLPTARDAIPRSSYVTRAEVEEALDGQRTVCLPHLDRHGAPWAELHASIRRDLLFVGTLDMRAYVSRPGSHTSTHFDAQLAIITQVSGSKTWRVGRQPLAPWPPANAILLPDGQAQWSDPLLATAAPPPAPDESEMDEITLRRGDVLVLPAGTWHEVIGDEESVAVNLVFKPASFASVLGTLTANTLEDGPEWRGGIPPVDGEGVGTALSYLAERFDDLRLLGERLGDEERGAALLASMAAYLDGNRTR